MAKLRAVAGNASFPFVGPKPSLNGDAGERVAECVVVEVKKRGNKTQCVLTLETVDGEVGRMWVQVQAPLTSTCRYLRYVRLALGRDPKPGEPIHPKSIFEGRQFKVAVGWRIEKHNPATAQLGPKDPKDVLRVHDLLERLE